ncbi:MAG: hypothetical protein OXC61_09880 [Flavobacteriaceae bacterium]|nr:hypothetical protein [Flavobacteriaceae bacterium]
MNHWLKLSIEYANQRSYLDDLFSIYPTIPDGIRDIDKKKWGLVKQSFRKQDNLELIHHLLNLELFPIKDSYVAYLRGDREAIKRNPKTINRLCGRVYEMGLDKIYETCSEPKETNRQIGPMFKNWVKTKKLGIKPCDLKEFKSNHNDAVLDAGDEEMKSFAAAELGYTHTKGIDFLARFNSRYIIGEAKFLTDFGGNQNNQFNDAMSFMDSGEINAIKIAILDGVLFIKGRKMHQSITEKYGDYHIMSALILRDFLYSI